MKKIFLVILSGLFLTGTVVLADVVTQRRVNPSSSSSSVPIQKTQYNNQQNFSNPQYGKITKTVRVAQNIKTCRPYSESLNSEYMGMNFSYDLKIQGWINNKCRVDFTSFINGSGSSFKDLYGVNADEAQIISFAPQIRCEFTKQQLEYVGDSLLQENERNNGAKNNMLKNPNSINMNSISDSDQRLFDVVVNQGACSILNNQDLENALKQLQFF